MDDLLKVQNLSAGHGEAVVLTDISLSLAEGKTLALLGRNGTGTTTLINTLAGATRLHAGSISLGGLALHKMPSHERASLGISWVPQERNIFKSLTVHENLTAVQRSARAGRTASPWTSTRVYEMFPRLAERKGNLGTQLSGGSSRCWLLDGPWCSTQRCCYWMSLWKGWPHHCSRVAARHSSNHA